MGVVVDPPTGNQLLLGRREAAKACGLGLRSWDRLAASGRVPQPVRLGRRTLWRADELRAWVDAGCPDRRAWEVIMNNDK